MAQKMYDLLIMELKDYDEINTKSRHYISRP